MSQGGQRDRGHARLPGRRLEADEQLDDLAGVAELRQERGDELLDGGAGGVHQRVGRGQVERRVAVAADLDPVGGEHGDGATGVVELEADAHGLYPHGRRGAGGGQVEHDRLGAALRAPEVRPQREAGQRPGRAAAEVGLEQVGDGLHAVGAAAEVDLDGGGQPQSARRPRLRPERDPEAGIARGHLDGIAGRGDRRARDQAGQLCEPRGPARRVGEHAVEPGRDGADAGGRQLLDGQRRDRGGGAQAEEGGERRERPGRGRRLGPHEAEHEVEGDVVELVEAAQAEVEVAGGPTGQLEAAQAQPDGRVVVVTRRRDVDGDGDRAEVDVAGAGRVVEVERGRQADPSAAVTEEQHRIRRGCRAPGDLEQRDVELALGARPGVRARRRHRPQLDAEPDHDRRLLRLEHHRDGQVGVVVGDEGQAHPTLVVGGDRAVVQDLVQERDECLALRVVGQHGAEPRRGVAQPARVGRAVPHDPERGGQVAQHAEVGGGDRHLSSGPSGCRA